VSTHCCRSRSRPHNSALQADRNRRTSNVGATVARAVPAAERWAVGRLKSHMDRDAIHQVVQDDLAEAHPDDRRLFAGVCGPLDDEGHAFR